MDVYGLGTLAMDVLMKVDHLPGEDSFCIVRSSERQPGGSGTNVIVQLARLGAQCGYLGAVGDDAVGRDVLASLADEKVDSKHMVIRPGGVTLHTDIVIDDEGRKFIMLNMGDAFDSLKPEELCMEAVGKAKVFYTDLLPTKTAAYALRGAKEMGLKTAFNMQVSLGTMLELGADKEDILNSLQYTDVFAPCQEGLYELTGSRDLDVCANVLRNYCQGLLLFTLGREGSVAYDVQGNRYFCPICEIKTVDTTGAGDSYMGAFLYQYCLQGADIETAMRFATRCAAYTCTGIGARHTPSLQELENFG